MTYCTVADLEARFGADVTLLADRDGDGAADAAVLEQAISDAAATIELHIAGRYRLPLEAIPPALNLIACDIARYQLHTDQAPEEVSKRYEQALGTLRRIAAGQINLESPQPTSHGSAHASAPERVFSRTTLEGF